ncbi:MAG: carboxypeptidase-like regulatory domain-containing protein [Thermoplasmata archaeon]
MIFLVAVPAVSLVGAGSPLSGSPRVVRGLDPAGYEAEPPVTTRIGPYQLTNGAHVDVGALVPYVLAQERADAAHLPRTAMGTAGRTSPSSLKHTSAVGGPVQNLLDARPVRPQVQGGVNGTVVDSVTGAPVSDANVSLVAQPPQPCGAINCSPTPTNAQGQFTVYGPAGLAEVQITAPNYLENDTLVQVPSGRVLRLGKVLLDHYAFVTGTVRGSDPAHEAVTSNEVSISTGSRNFTLPGGSGSPNSTGQFAIEVPPVPDYVMFSPTSVTGPYLENTTYIDPTPYQNFSLGTVFLPTGTGVNVTIVDRTTGKTIAGASYSVTACVLDSGSCPFSATAAFNSSGPLLAYALPGPTFIQVAAVGYVANQTVIGTVPDEPLNRTFPVTVELVPDAVLVFQTNVTGGDIPPAMANLTYGLARVCSLSSIQNGFLGNESGGVVPSLCAHTSIPYRDFTPNQVLFIPPLRSETELLSHWVGINPSQRIYCVIPLKNQTTNITRQIPGHCKDSTLLYLPIYFNQTVLNATPGEVINIGTINSTPGGWINGSVVVAETSTAPSQGFTVQVCSTAVAGWCDNATSSPNESTRWYHDCPGTFGPTYFCAPSPPGPVVISVIAPGYTPNETWANLPFECCNRLGPNSTGISLVNVTTDHSPVINLSGPGTGIVSGRVLSRLADGMVEALGGTSVENCPVLANFLDIGCNTTLTNPNGSFSFPVLRGWENIIGAAPEMTSNGTWVYMEASNTTGTIWLIQPAIVAGTVVTPTGIPVPGASVQICPASLPAVCRLLGSGITSAGGAFSAAYPGAAFPGDAYRIVVDAAGYTEGAAWGNLTSGNLTDLGRIVLVPVGNGTASEFGHLRSGNSSFASPTWLDGNVVDNQTGMPLWGYLGQACPVLSPTRCTALTGPISNPEFAGNFNVSVSGGPTWVNVSEPGFTTRSLYVNISGTVVHLGRIALDPLPRATGRVLFANWTNATVTDGLAPSAVEISLCDSYAGVCGVGTFPSGNGTFNVSGPPGPSDTLFFHPIFAALPVDYLGPGVGSLSEAVDMPVGGSALPTQPGKVPELPVYTEVTGLIGDGSTANATLHRGAEPHP